MVPPLWNAFYRRPAFLPQRQRYRKVPTTPSQTWICLAVFTPFSPRRLGAPKGQQTHKSSLWMPSNQVQKSLVVRSRNWIHGYLMVKWILPSPPQQTLPENLSSTHKSSASSPTSPTKARRRFRGWWNCSQSRSAANSAWRRRLEWEKGVEVQVQG